MKKSFMDITIRRASIEDLPAICNLSQLLFDYERQFTDEFNMSWSHAKEGREFFAKRLKSRKSFVLLAQDGNKLVGYILITLEKFAWRAFNPIADVVNLSVAPGYRGKGIGTKLFQQAKKFAIKRGAKRISVSALTGNTRTLKFYRRQGFGDFNVTMVMKPYRFSPIQNKTQMMEAIKHIHATCYALCMQSMGRYLPVAGNIGIFCHYDDEFAFLKRLLAELTDLSTCVYGKYFKLHEPIVIPAKGDIPKATYSFLYIRKPDPNKNHVGDLDFYLEPEKYAKLKQSLLNGKLIKGARILPNRPDLNLIELYDPNTDALGFIGNKKWQ